MHDDTELAEATRRRHASGLHKVLSRWPRERTIAVTRHAEVNRASVQAWLARWGIQDLVLECRPDNMAENIVAIARYKAATATRWGCTHFIESDPEQAIRIAAVAPHLMVAWWPTVELRPWVIGAAASVRSAEAGE
jgi:hypothetical protein